MTILVTCPKCNSDDLTLPNRYRTMWRCRACGARFAKPMMEQKRDLLELDRQAEVVGDMLREKAEKYIRNKPYL